MRVYIDTDRCHDCAPGFCDIHFEMLENPQPEYLTFELSWEEVRDFAALGQPYSPRSGAGGANATRLASEFGKKVREALIGWGLDAPGPS